MQELFNSAEGIVAFIAALLGGGTGIGAIIAAIINGVVNKKYARTVAAATVKDTQITDLENKINKMMEAIGYLISAFATQQMSSLALPADVKQQIVTMVQKVKDDCGIKLDDIVNQALKFMTDPKASEKLQEARDEVEKKAAEAAQKINDLKEKSADVVTAVANVIDQIEIK